MKIILHIGPDARHSERFQSMLAEKRNQLSQKGVLYASSPGNKNHTRLYMAVSDPEHPDQLRFNRGYGDPAEQARLRAAMMEKLTAEVDAEKPDMLVLSAHQLGDALVDKGTLQTLKDMLAPLSTDISILAHIEDQARMLVRRYALLAIDGRANGPEAELALCEAENWWQAALDARHDHAPLASCFSEVQGPTPWLDYSAWVRLWESVFGPGRVTLRAIDDRHWLDTGTDELREALGIEQTIGKAEAARIAAMPSGPTVARAVRFNALFLELARKETLFLPRQPWRRIMGDLQVAGEQIAPGRLSAISKRFEKDNKTLLKAHAGLTETAMKRDRKLPDWTDPDPLYGFRASQYLVILAPRLRALSQEEAAKRDPQTAPDTPEAPTPEPQAPAPLISVPPERQLRLTPAAEKLLPARAKENFDRLRHSSFAPHNVIGRVNEEELAAPFEPAPERRLPKGSSGNVIVGCMKNEAPYILEWVAYHRAIGVDNFLIYTNGCEDGSDEILDRLDAMGIVDHRNNDDWKGNSPQQHALNAALKEDVIRNSEWIIHIDVDEFINIRCDNGTLQDFFARVPDATNVAMTWRLFGHSGVTRLEDRFVIEQFDTCAPKFCPKPHTVWGFKTMSRNIGAYKKLSCHRPNKLVDGMDDKVRWVNGSGRDMTGEALKNGWRNSKKSIGYDLLQLNHYALRSAESFLIKRQRGRALHVDRSIGLNYWIRMDWSGARDITIQRNLPRLRAEFDRLIADDKLAKLHRAGMAWHRAKAEELHANPEFRELYEQALELNLTETERVAYALALDMES